MKPIISPWVIYLIDLVDKFQGIINAALCVLGFVIVGLGIMWLLFSMEYDQDDSIIVTCKKYLKKSPTRYFYDKIKEHFSCVGKSAFV